MGKKAIKRRRAKFGKRVQAGTMTVTEARARLGRDVAQKSYGAHGALGRSPPPAFQPGMDPDEYLRSALRAPMPGPPAPVITKAAKTAQKRYEQNLASVRSITKMLRDSAPPPSWLTGGDGRGHATAAGPVVKQLTRPERAAVAELRRQLGRVAHDPARREEVSAQIARITGDPFTLGGL